MQNTPKQIVDRLNDLLEKDPEVLEALIKNRVPANQAVAESEYFVVSANETEDGYERPKIGLLGVLNGITEDVRIEAVFGDNGSLEGFRARKPRPERKTPIALLQLLSYALTDEGGTFTTELYGYEGTVEVEPGRNQVTLEFDHFPRTDKEKGRCQGLAWRVNEDLLAAKGHVGQLQWDEDANAELNRLTDSYRYDLSSIQETFTVAGRHTEGWELTLNRPAIQVLLQDGFKDEEPEGLPEDFLQILTTNTTGVPGGKGEYVYHERFPPIEENYLVGFDAWLKLKVASDYDARGEDWFEFEIIGDVSKQEELSRRIESHPASVEGCKTRLPVDSWLWKKPDWHRRPVLLRSDAIHKMIGLDER